MTVEEAKTNLEKLLLLYDDGLIDFSVIRESIKVAISALEKQVPMKPKPKILAVEQPFKNHKAYIHPCGSCGEGINFLHMFCPWCGQALDNTEDEK